MFEGKLRFESQVKISSFEESESKLRSLDLFRLSGEGKSLRLFE